MLPADDDTDAEPNSVLVEVVLSDWVVELDMLFGPDTPPSPQPSAPARTIPNQAGPLRRATTPANRTVTAGMVVLKSL